MLSECRVWFLQVRRENNWPVFVPIYINHTQKLLKARSTKTKLQLTCFRLDSDPKIGVNGTMLYQCNPTAFNQSEASWKPVGCKFKFGVNEP